METTAIDTLTTLEDSDAWVFDECLLSGDSLGTVDPGIVTPLPELLPGPIDDTPARSDPAFLGPTGTTYVTGTTSHSISPTATNTTTTTTTTKERNREYQARYRQRVKADRQQLANTIAELKKVQSQLASTEEQLQAAHELLSKSGLSSIDTEVDTLTDDELIYRTEDPSEQSFFSHIRGLVEQLSGAEPNSSTIMSHVFELHALVQYFEDRLEPQVKVSSATPQTYAYWTEVHRLILSATPDMQQLTLQLRHTRIANLRVAYRVQTRLSQQLTALTRQYRVVERGLEFRALLGDLLGNLEKIYYLRFPQTVAVTGCASPMEAAVILLSS